MRIAKTTFAALIAVAAFSVPAFAQEEEGFKLPDQCTSSAGGMDHSAMGHGGANGEGPGMGAGMMAMGGMDMGSMPEHVQENMRRMMQTMPAMHRGMMNEDPDVAFACAMIAHHQGAIDMAEVLLEHGDDEEMRRLAEEIIKAQVGEIEVMTDWLAKNAE
jgi:uncharacterized protein (DUF305 family)